MSIDNELLENSQTLEEETEDNTEVEPSDSNDEDTGNSDEGESEEPDYKALYEKEKSMRQGLVKKLQVSKVVKSQPKEVSQSTYSEERLDKLELRQLDPDLTAEQIQEILLIKKAKGFNDVSQAYENPMVQSWLATSKAESEHKDKVKRAIPKAQSKTSVSAPAKTTLNKSSNWLKNMPSESTEDVAKIIEETFFGN